MSEQIFEEILEDNNSRFTLFPIKYPKLWEAYETQENKPAHQDLQGMRATFRLAPPLGALLG